MRLSYVSIVSTTALACLCWSCGGANSVIDPKAPELPNSANKPKQITGRQTEFLVVDRSSHQRAQLEADAKTNKTVVVRYDGCSLEILSGCTVQGEYKYTQVNQKTDVVKIADDKKLQAEIPLGAASFRTHLRKAGQLNVNTIIVGSYKHDPPAVPYWTLNGDCARATHYVAVRTVGAFVFRTAAKGEIGAEAAVWNAETELEWIRSNSELSRDGSRSACAQSTENDTRPPQKCSATIGITLARFQGDNTPIACEDQGPDGGAQKTWGWVAMSVGAVGAATFATTGIMALSNRSSLDKSENCNSSSHACKNRQSDVDAYNLSRTISMIAFPIGIVGLGTGTTLLLTAPSSQSTEVAGTSLHPWFGIGSLGLGGSF